MEYYAIKPHYFDASALVKLVADDDDEVPGRAALRKYHAEHAHPGYTTSFCVAGKYRILDGPSKSVLITADRELARVARAEDVKAWECTSEPSPPSQ